MVHYLQDWFALLCCKNTYNNTHDRLYSMISITRHRSPSPTIMSNFQPPDISKIAKATPLPDSPAGDDPNDNSNNNSPSVKITRPSLADFTESKNTANAKIHLCLRFKNVATLHLQSCTFQQRSEGDHPSEESRDGAKGMKRTWYNDILKDEGGTGLSEVLKASFRLEAEAELRRLAGFGHAAIEATDGARAAWKRVLDEVIKCRILTEDVNRAMGQFK
jgi:hypothetical protein